MPVSLKILRALSVCAAPDGCSRQGLFYCQLPKEHRNNKGLCLYFLSLFLTLQRYDFFLNYANKMTIILYRKVLKISVLNAFIWRKNITILPYFQYSKITRTKALYLTSGGLVVFQWITSKGIRFIAL